MINWARYYSCPCDEVHAGWAVKTLFETGNRVHPVTFVPGLFISRART